ncbi:ion transport protein, partial [Plasmodium ovale curtisi]
NSESLEYIDGSINLSYENYNDHEKMNKIWENCGEYIYTFELVSANIFVDEMLHNLVSFSLPISKYAIEYSVIYSLIGIDINEYSKNAKTFHKYLKLSTGNVRLIPIPSYFYKKSFYKCFSYFLHNRQCLCIGILRYMDTSPLCTKSKKLFILSCPSRTMKIERCDQVRGRKNTLLNGRVKANTWCKNPSCKENNIYAEKKKKKKKSHAAHPFKTASSNDRRKIHFHSMDNSGSGSGSGSGIGSGIGSGSGSGSGSVK